MICDEKSPVLVCGFPYCCSDTDDNWDAVRCLNKGPDFKE